MSSARRAREAGNLADSARFYTEILRNDAKHVEALAQQTPLWQPGTKAAYHVHNMGYLLGEVMKRVCGKSVSRFVREEVTGPLGAEYNIGHLTAAEIERVVEVMPNMSARLFAAKDGGPYKHAISRR